ncbi:MAG TPA: molybdate ABC transporter substrate-binding protein [Jatrophihabitans sp.]|jgi:molybdate transport system substrate-binding protein|uniref:molybdate ABC transporter substrate-binding protein n=1 Tax=Jatrophihabitans sp. TaxID=1932789 RepID=UPI002EEC69B4
MLERPVRDQPVRDQSGAEPPVREQSVRKQSVREQSVPERGSRARGWLTATAAALALTAGCATTPAAAPGAADGSALGGTVTVFAAASLTEVFGTLARQFQAKHPGTRVRLNIGASSALALQITQGAPADVFASAATVNMDQLARAGAVSGVRDFAGNALQLAVPAGNPARVQGLADLARPGVKVALCQAQVPCGAAAVAVLGKAGLRVTPVTLEADVRATLTKVRTGEVDAGLVYVTDVRSAGATVRGIAIPPALNTSVRYPIGVLREARNRAGAEAFTAYVLSAEGRRVLSAAGFTTP